LYLNAQLAGIADLGRQESELSHGYHSRSCVRSRPGMTPTPRWALVGKRRYRPRSS
jgi:hypothetical protein